MTAFCLAKMEPTLAGRDSLLTPLRLVSISAWILRRFSNTSAGFVLEIHSTASSGLMRDLLSALFEVFFAGAGIEPLKVDPDNVDPLDDDVSVFSVETFLSCNREGTLFFS